MVAEVKHTIATALFLFGLGCLVGHLCGCTADEQLRVEHAAKVAGYDQILLACKEEGKASGSFAVFEACERSASRRLCFEHPEIQDKWARCKEVLP